MKSFKEYLTESKKVYEFKLRFAGELDSDKVKKIKTALEQYKVESCSAPRRTPIQESPIDFPSIKNTNVSIVDVTLAYPTNSLQVKAALTDAGFNGDHIVVRNLAEEAEVELNHANDKKSGEALLSKDYETSNDGQKLVGEKQKMALLKELTKNKHSNSEYTGVNDQLLAKSIHKETANEISKPKKTSSTVGSKKVKVPTAKGL